MLSISPMKRGEEQEVLKLIRSTFDKTVAAFYSIEGQKEFYRYIDHDAFLKRQGLGHETYVVKDGMKIVGVLEVRNSRHIALLFVDDSCRGKGIGHTFLNYLSDVLLKNTGVLTVNSSPNSVGFYMRMGFKPTGPEQLINGLRFTHMSKKLSE